MTTNHLTSFAAAAALLPGLAAAQGLTIFLPENAAYRYVNATASTTVGSVPGDWFSPSFDDSSWFEGSGAFGTGFGSDLPNAHGPGTPDAPQFPGGTPWSTHRDPYLRATFDLPRAMDLTIWIAVDNGVEAIYLNGISTGQSFNAEGDARRWEHVVDVPAAFVQAGTNLVALQIEDHGVATGFAMVITEDDPADNPTFGGGSAFCFGVGCPCGNDDPAAGCANGGSTTGAQLLGSGLASVVSDTFVLHAAGSTPAHFGLFFQGDAAVNGGNGEVFGDGLRCAGGTTVALELLQAGAGGAAATGPGIAARTGLSGGETRYYQWWYRDPFLSPCGTGFNLSNGLEIAWAP